MARTPAFVPDPWTLMQQVIADADPGERADRCLYALHRSGRLKRYNRKVNAWMDRRAAMGIPTVYYVGAFADCTAEDFPAVAIIGSDVTA